MKHLSLLPACLVVFTSAGCGSSNPNDSEGAGTDTGADAGVDSGTVDTDTGDESPYAVTVGGESLPIRRAAHFERPVNFVRFDYPGDQTIAITTGLPFTDYTLSPETRNIATQLSGNTVSFTLSEPEYLIFNTDSQAELLLVIVDPPEENPPQLGAPNVVNIMEVDGMDNTGGALMTVPIQTAIDSVAGTGNILYFPPGRYLTGELWMRDDMTLYLADGAVLKGSSNLADIVTADSTGSIIEQCLHALVRMYDVSNSHIKGRGTIDANGAYHRNSEDPGTKYNLLKIEESDHCTVDGVIALDSSFWSTIIYRSDSIDIKNYKVINHWLTSGWNETDGVDFDNSTNGTLSNALLYVGDDCMSTKSDDIPDGYGIPAVPEGSTYPEDPTSSPAYMAVSNIRHDDVVCYTNQAACKIGTKTMGTEMSEVYFDNIDAVRCGRGLVVDNMDTATVHDIHFGNIVFETGPPSFIAAEYVIRKGTDWRYSEGVGAIADIIADNIVYNNYTAGSQPPLFRFQGRTASDVNPPEEYPIGALTFTDVYIGDLKLTDDNVGANTRLVTALADSVTFQ